MIIVNRTALIAASGIFLLGEPAAQKVCSQIETFFNDSVPFVSRTSECGTLVERAFSLHDHWDPNPRGPSTLATASVTGSNVSAQVASYTFSAIQEYKQRPAEPWSAVASSDGITASSCEKIYLGVALAVLAQFPELTNHQAKIALETIELNSYFMTGRARLKNAIDLSLVADVLGLGGYEWPPGLHPRS